jgi:sporulation protein YlmC with PRC-barrel domain
MLRSLNSLIGNRIIAKDGAAGTTLDLTVNCIQWHIGDLVTSVGSWWRSYEVRIPSVSLQRPVGATGMLPVSLTKKQMKESQSTDNNGSLQRELKSDLLSAGVPIANFTAPRPIRWSSLVAYRVYALDGPAGVLRDMILNDENWHIRYLVVELTAESVNHQTLVSSDWISGVNENQSSVSLNLSIRELIGSPAYDPKVPVNRDIEGNLYDYYGQPFRHQ